MKKYILILFSFLFVFSLKINAYEFYISYSDESNYILYYDNSSNILKAKRVLNNNILYDSNSNRYFYLNLSGIKNNNEKKLEFNSFLKENIDALNDFYIQQTNPFLNYLYNESTFNIDNYLEYTNYAILYDENGLAVESIVNDVWAGLYSDSEKGVSGRLYSFGGQLLYVNGKPINWMESQIIKLMDMVSSSMREVVAVLGSMVPYIVAAVFVLLILYYVVSVGRRAIMPSNVKVRKRFLGSHNDEC